MSHTCDDGKRMLLPSSHLHGVSYRLSGMELDYQDVHLGVSAFPGHPHLSHAEVHHVIDPVSGCPLGGFASYPAPG